MESYYKPSHGKRLKHRTTRGFASAFLHRNLLSAPGGRCEQCPATQKKKTRFDALSNHTQNDSMLIFNGLLKISVCFSQRLKFHGEVCHGITARPGQRSSTRHRPVGRINGLHDVLVTIALLTCVPRVPRIPRVPRARLWGLSWL